MTAPALFALLLAAAGGPLPCTEGGPVRGVGGTGDPELRTLYEQGRSYAAFHDAATRRRELWDRNYERGPADAGLAARARAVGGTWHLLVVAVDGCSDSVSTIPYLARLVEAVPGLDMRIVDSTVGRAVMEARRTADGRAATPTVVLLDAEYDEAGCLIERPRDLKDFLEERGGTLSAADLYEAKMAWYDRDAGAATVAEVVDLMEAAAAGRARCAP